MSEAKPEKKYRTRGCLGWSLIFSFFVSSLIGLAAISIGKDRPVSSSNALLGSMQLFIVIVGPLLLMALIIGLATSLPVRPWLSSIVITCCVFFAYYLIMVILFGIGDDTTVQVLNSPTHPGFTWFVILSGILLGFLASFGYWHAGRRDTKT